VLSPVARTWWPATVAALAVVAASIGDGAWTRRSAIAWMMGSWGARLAVQAWYTRTRREAAGDDERSPPGVRHMLVLAASAIVCSTPAWLAAFNRAPELSSIELAACGLWLVGFAGETTANRQRLRFVTAAANAGLPCRAGLWRYSRHVDRIFTGLVWIAFTLFGLAAFWRP
jgi:steroid 5-alpha reductase family enzyme